ncbi:hypothetical protein [Mesorhizobium sp. M0041]|uniref:hypothetical protein n=1 Tax=Mesorhizobium sp. M0041 TaxID=2956856 RepID=UPI0033373E5A
MDQADDVGDRKPHRRVTTFEHVTEHLSHLVDEIYNEQSTFGLGYLSPQQFEDQHIRQTGQNAV